MTKLVGVRTVFLVLQAHLLLAMGPLTNMDDLSDRNVYKAKVVGRQLQAVRDSSDSLDDAHISTTAVDSIDEEDVVKKKITSESIRADFAQGFLASLSVIVLSELGDKTFFIAAILAMANKSRVAVFAGVMSANALMHVVSVLLGHAITVVPRLYTYYASSLLFAGIGICMLKEGWRMSANEAEEEMEEVQEELKARKMKDRTARAKGRAGKANLLWSLVPKVFVQAFTMTFLAEWGDRSQLATIVLAAREEIKSVIIGGILGHAFCTGLAVLGGRFIAQRISVRTVTLVGGVVFILFSLAALSMDPNEVV